MKKILVATAFALSTLASFATFAAGPGEASGEINLTGEVPVYCVADLDEINGTLDLGNELGWTEFKKDYEFMLQCNDKAKVNVTITGNEDCGDYVFGGNGKLQRDFCLQNTADADAKLPYAVKAWGRTGNGNKCGSDFHDIVSGHAFHLKKECFTEVGDGAWKNYKTIVKMSIIIDPASNPLHLPAGTYTDTLSVLVSWS